MLEKSLRHFSTLKYFQNGITYLQKAASGRSVGIAYFPGTKNRLVELQRFIKFCGI